jgi:hypothetical protein
MKAVLVFVVRASTTRKVAVRIQAVMTIAHTVMLLDTGW